MQYCSKFVCRISWLSFGDRNRDRKPDESNLFKNAEVLKTRDWESSLFNTSTLKFPVRANQKSQFCNVEDLDLLAARTCKFTYISRPFQVSKQHHCLHSFFYTFKNSYKHIHTTPQSITNPKRFSNQIQKEKQSPSELLEQIFPISWGKFPPIAEPHRQSAQDLSTWHS